MREVQMYSALVVLVSFARLLSRWRACAPYNCKKETSTLHPGERRRIYGKLAADGRSIWPHNDAEGIGGRGCKFSASARVSLCSLSFISSPRHYKSSPKFLGLSFFYGLSQYFPSFFNAICFVDSRTMKKRLRRGRVVA